MDKNRCEELYEMEEIIGEGTFSSVVRAVHNASKLPVAIKIIDKTKIENPKQLSRIHNEIALHKKCKHPNIVSFLEAHETSIDVCIVMELCKGGELFDRIVKKGSFSERDACFVVRQVLLAVNYLHSMGIVHRDIKPENILYTSQEADIIKLADFGLSKQLMEKPEGRAYLKASLSGTPAYCAPERLSEHTESKAVDIWSIGCIAYFLLFGVPPFYSEKEDEDEHDNEVIDSVIEGIVKFRENRQVSDQARDLILRLLDKDPTRRITAEDALLHPWIRNHSLSDSEAQPYYPSSSEDSAHLKTSINRVIDASSHATTQDDIDSSDADA